MFPDCFAWNVAGRLEKGGSLANQRVTSKSMAVCDI